MTTPDLYLIAREMKEAQDHARQIVPFTARFPDFDLDAAYRAAHRIHAAHRAEGRIPVGRKIGFTNANIWPEYGVNQTMWGYVYDRTVTRLDGVEATCSLHGLAEPRIEPEIVLGLATVPAPGADPAAVLDAVAWVAHGFEIVQSHFPGWKFQVADTVADGGLHGRLFVGPPRPVEKLGAHLAERLRSFSVELSCDGVTKDVGRGANVLGSPLSALAHLATVLAAQPGSDPLRPGEIVTTGTLTAAYPVAPGEVWRSRLEGIDLPGLQLTFTE